MEIEEICCVLFVCCCYLSGVGVGNEECEMHGNENKWKQKQPYAHKPIRYHLRLKANILIYSDIFMAYFICTI